MSTRLAEPPAGLDAPALAERDAWDHRSSRWKQAALVGLAVGGAAFFLALDNGSYELADRTRLAVAVWWALALGIAFALYPRDRLPRSARVVGGALALLALLTALSVSWSDSAEKSFNELDRVLLYLGAFLLVVLATRRGDGARWCNGLAVGVTAVGVLALVSAFFPEFVGPGMRNPSFPTVNRLSYPVNYWNGLAVLAALGIPLVLRAAIVAVAPAFRALALSALPLLVAVIYLTSSRGGAAAAICGTAAFLALTGPRLPAIAATVAGVTGGVGAVLMLAARHELVDGPTTAAAAASQGRSAAVLLAMICAGTGLTWWGWCRVLEPRLPGFPGRRFRAAMLVALVAGIGVGLVLFDPVQRFHDFRAPPTEQQISPSDYTRAHLLSANGSGRWQLWESAFDEWQDRPFTGRGAGSFEAWWAQYGTLSKFVRDAHSLYAEMLGELGAFGLGLVLVLLGSGLVAAGSRIRAASGERRVTLAALTGTLVTFALAAAVDWMWELTIVALVGVACLGLLTGPATAGQPSREGPNDAAPAKRRRLPGPTWRTAIASLAIVAVVLEGVALLSEARLQTSQNAAGRGDHATAISAANESRALAPWAASPRLQSALLAEELGDLPGARAEIQAALNRDPSDWRLWLVSARIDVESELIPEARRSLARAKALNPRSPLFVRKSAPPDPQQTSVSPR